MMMDYGKVENLVDNVFSIVFIVFPIPIVENIVLSSSVLRVFPQYSKTVENIVWIIVFPSLIWKTDGKMVG